jgi:acetyl-CoA C-acetyltransferase
MGDTKLIDLMVSPLTDPFGVGHMGITAENLAKKWNITREQQDAFAATSHQKAAKAIAEGRFKEQIVPITIKTRKGDVVVDTDEGVKGETTAESLSKLKPVFLKENGTVTAGNASSINDGASFFVLASAQAF